MPTTSLPLNVSRLLLMRRCLLASALFLVAIAAITAERDITAERLRNADKEPDNWLLYGGTYRSLRYSPLDQINTHNVGGLTAAWAFQLGVVDWGLQSTPL